MKFFVLLILILLSVCSQNQCSSADNVIPEPWTPIKTTKDSVSCWNRTYDFSKGILPSRITSGGEELLSGPMILSARIDGRAVRLNCSTKINQIDDGTAAIQTIGKSEDIYAQCSYKFEYDGFLLCDLTITPKAAFTKIDSLEILIPLNKGVAKLFHHHPVKPVAEQRWATDKLNCGAIPKSGMALPFVHHIWIGNEQRGLQWFAESDEALKISGNFATISGAKVLRLKLLDNQNITVQKPFHFVFGFMASPVKPQLPVGDIRWSFGWVDPKCWNHDRQGKLVEPEKSRLAEMHNSGYNCFNLWGNQFLMGDPYIADPDLPNILKAAKGFDMAPITCCGIWLDARVESADNTWPLVPTMTWQHPTRPEYVGHLMCQRGGWRDWFISRVDKAFRELNVSGIYFDGSATPQKCANLEHGCGYKDVDGKIHPTLPILATRDMMKRVYAISRSVGRKTYIVAHTSSTIMLPCLSFADAYFEGEHVGRFPEDERYTLDGFRAEMMGYPYGITGFYLKYNRNPGDEERCSTYALLHGMMPIAAVHLDRAWKAFNDFDTTGAKWIPYWEQDQPVKTAANVKISSYVKKGAGALLVTANISHEQISTTIEIDTDIMGLKQAKAFDAVTGSQMDFKAGVLCVSIPAGNYTLIRIDESH